MILFSLLNQMTISHVNLVSKMLRQDVANNLDEFAV